MRAPDLHRTTRNCAYLVDLPPELVTAICAFIECRTVVLCRLVCKRLRDIIDASLELQYRIELVQDGMVDGHGRARCGDAAIRRLSTDDRLARLRTLREAWKTLRWTRCVTVPLPGPCCAYELVGGIFCKTQPGWGEVPGPGVLGEWYGNVNGDGDGNGNGEEEGGEGGEGNQLFGSRSMYATWLPGVDTPGRTVIRDDLGIPTRDFAMDPSQDLMVLFKGGSEDLGIGGIVAVFPGALELHARTISTNEVHPEAGKAVLSTQVLYPIMSVFLQIVEDVVGVMYCVNPASPNITIWNWKTGSLLVDCSDTDLPPGTWDFSFINSRALFVTTGIGSGALELFTFTCDASDPTSYETPTSTFTHAATLRLPLVHPPVGLLSVGTHTGPFLATCPPDKPFVASNEDRIHVLTIQYVHSPMLEGPRTRPRVCVFLHNRVLEDYFKRGVDRGVGARAMEVPWDEWGRTRARVLPYVGIFQWLRYVHGQRVVLLLPTSETGKSTLQVLDFNVRIPSGSYKVDGLVDYPTQIVMPNLFLDVVESGLPYRETCREVRGDYSGVMIDDERLVALKYPAFLTGDMKEIDVFTMG